jgi:hypothetical protein
MNLKSLIPNKFYLGTTSNYEFLRNDATLQKLVTDHFNLITSDQDFKLGAIGRYPGQAHLIWYKLYLTKKQL